MNSIKNAIVTVTLLAVGYGSYVVLNSPPDADFARLHAGSAQAGLEPGRLQLDSLDDAPLEVPNVQLSLNSLPQPAMSSHTEPDFPELSSPTNVNSRPQTPSSTAAAEPPPLLPPLPASRPAATQIAADAAARFSGLANPEQNTVGDTAPQRGMALANQPTDAAQRFADRTVDAFGFPPAVTEGDHDDSNSRPASSSLTSPRVATTAESNRASDEPTPMWPDEAAQPPVASLAPPVRAARNPFDEPIMVDDVPDQAVASDEHSASAQSAPLADSANLAEDNVSVPPQSKSQTMEPDETVLPIEAAENSASPAFDRAWFDVTQQVNDRDLAGALASLSPWYRDPALSSEQQRRCSQLLDQLAGTVIYSREHILEPAYTVRAGETLREIADRHSVPEDLLAKINGIAPPFALATGETLKVVRGPFRADVSLQHEELTLFLGQHYAGRFRCQIGRDLPREESHYDIAEKSNGRNYFDRKSGNEVLKGDANNRYGNHWLGLRGEQITTGHSVGLHGRPYGSSLPESELGSVSLDPVDAEDVFSILSVGSRVQVRR